MEQRVAERLWWTPRVDPSEWGSVCIQDGSSVRVTLVRDALTPGHLAFPPARGPPIAPRCWSQVRGGRVDHGVKASVKIPTLECVRGKKSHGRTIVVRIKVAAREIRFLLQPS